MEGPELDIRVRSRRPLGSGFAITDRDVRFDLLIDIFVEGLARRAATWETDR